jgi:hypothetical protein
MKPQRRKGKFFLPFFILITLFGFVILLEEISPTFYIKNLKKQNLFTKPPKIHKKEVIFGVLADNNERSLISREDLKNINFHKLIIFMNENTPSYFEGKFNGNYVFISQDNKCKELFSVNLEKDGLFSKVRKLKFHFFYSFDKEKAFYYKYKNLKKEAIFSEFNPVKNICLVGKNEGGVLEKSIKESKKIMYPDINYQLKLIRNVLYINKEESLFYENKENFINAINKGNLYVYFYKNPDITVKVRTKDKSYTLGDLINIRENPKILFFIKPRYITGVYINGKLKEYYQGSFTIIPKSAGYYQFVVFDYKYKLPFLDLFFAFDIVAITNPIYFE